MLFTFFKQTLVPNKQHHESRLAHSSVGTWDGLYDHIGCPKRPDRNAILKKWCRGWEQSYFYLVSVGRVSTCSVCRLAHALVFHKFPERQSPKQCTGPKGRHGTRTQATWPTERAWWQELGGEEEAAGATLQWAGKSREDESKKSLKLLLANTLR